MPWICQAFDSRQNREGNSGAFFYRVLRDIRAATIVTSRYNMYHDICLTIQYVS